MVAPRVAPRVALHACDAALTRLLVAAKGARGVLVLAKAIRQHGRILDRHRATLREKRQHRVRGVAEQRDRTSCAYAALPAVEQRPFLPALRECEQRTRGRRETLEARQQLGCPARRAPARLMP